MQASCTTTRMRMRSSLGLPTRSMGPSIACCCNEARRFRRKKKHLVRARCISPPPTASPEIYPLHGTDCCTAVKSGLSRLRDGPMLYLLHEMQRTLLAPWVYGAEAAAKAFASPNSWLSQLPGATRLSAGYEVFFRVGKDYEKPEFGIREVIAHGHTVPIVE